MIYFDHTGFCSLMITVMSNQKLNVENSEIHVLDRTDLLTKSESKMQRSAETSLRRISQRRNIPAPNHPCAESPGAETTQRRMVSAPKRSRRTVPAPKRPRRIAHAEPAAPNSPFPEIPL